MAGNNQIHSHIAVVKMMLETWLCWSISTAAYIEYSSCKNDVGSMAVIGRF
jgi:hypothetical protein